MTDQTGDVQREDVTRAPSPYAEPVAPRPVRTVWCCTCDGPVEIGPHNHLGDNPDHYIVEVRGEFHVWRNPSACGEEAALERAHWWNQGAKAERRRIEQERSHYEGYRIALRPEQDGQDPALMDDIVVKGVSMFRAEAMGDGEWFACCYLEGSDDRIAWWISSKCRPRRIEWITTEHPDVVYEDRAERSARIAPSVVSGRHLSSDSNKETR